MTRTARYLCTSPPLFVARDVIRTEYPDAGPLFERHLGPFGVTDCLTVNAHATVRHGLMIHAPSTRIVTLDQTVQRRWRMLAAHLASGLRLRRALHEAIGGNVAGDRTEAVLSSTGRVEAAFGRARSPHARRILRKIVRRLDRVRAQAARRGGEVADDALALWTGLIDGRWSIVDRFDSDGRRYLVAYRNDCTFPDPRALSPHEAQVCRLLAYGNANKQIAHELGLQLSTVANHVVSARHKLRANSRFDLIRILRCLMNDVAQAPTKGP